MSYEFKLWRNALQKPGATTLTLGRAKVGGKEWSLEMLDIDGQPIYRLIIWSVGEMPNGVTQSIDDIAEQALFALPRRREASHDKALRFATAYVELLPRLLERAIKNDASHLPQDLFRDHHGRKDLWRVMDLVSAGTEEGLRSRLAGWMGISK
jgi:hypothetical protein